MRTLLGELLQKLRKAQGFTLRRFAQEVELDPSYYSRVERGETAPPNEDVLARIASKLGVVVGVSPEWDELMATANVARGRIPEDVLQQRHIAEMLPAFFARLQKGPIESPDQMYEVAKQILAERVTPAKGATATVDPENITGRSE